MSRVTSVCNSPNAAYVESETATTYPTPPTSTSTEFGRFSASLPRNCPIIARQYCRLTFACQTHSGFALFLLKMVPEVVDPAMGSFQLGGIQRQSRAIEATNIRVMKLLFVIHPCIGRLEAGDLGRQTREKIVGWNHRFRIIFTDDGIGLSARKYGLDGQNEHVNIFQVTIERRT